MWTLEVVHARYYSSFILFQNIRIFIQGRVGIPQKLYIVFSASGEAVLIHSCLNRDIRRSILDNITAISPRFTHPLSSRLCPFFNIVIPSFFYPPRLFKHLLFHRVYAWLGFMCDCCGKLTYKTYSYTMMLLRKLIRCLHKYILHQNIPHAINMLKCSVVKFMKRKGYNLALFFSVELRISLVIT